MDPALYRRFEEGDPGEVLIIPDGLTSCLKGYALWGLKDNAR
jgi:hypothetical protein